ncbi:serine/Arginine-related protein 53 isoform X3 [Struthio camelus]|uniref:serine/Arginine-related protein 53 isoform X3 n=1 Tax=Struthio camelus TaxID=8801 RepID=UPI003603DE94
MRFCFLWEVLAFSALEIRVCCQGDKSLKMGCHSSDTEEENRSRRKKKHRRRSSSSSSSDSRTYTRKKSGRKSRSRSRDLQSRSHSYEKRRRHRSSSSSSYGSRRKRSRSRSRGRGKSYRSQRSRSKSRTRRSRSRPRQRSYSRSSERSGHRRTHSGSRERERRKGREKEKGKGKEKEICGTKHGDSGNIKAGLEHLTPAEQAKARLQLVLEAADVLVALGVRSRGRKHWGFAHASLKGAVPALLRRAAHQTRCFASWQRRTAPRGQERAGCAVAGRVVPEQGERFPSRCEASRSAAAGESHASGGAPFLAAQLAGWPWPLALARDTKPSASVWWTLV